MHEPGQGARVGGALPVGRDRRRGGAAAHATAAHRVSDAAAAAAELRAQLLKILGRVAAARDAYDRAIGLSEKAAVRAFLLGRRP